MVRRVYAHLGDVRHRSEVVEYRLEQHLDRRLGLSGPSVTGKRYCGRAPAPNEFPRRARSHCGGSSSESGRPDSNRRRPAWEAT